MRDAAYPDDGDPFEFAAWLINRLEEIPGTTWHQSPPLTHTSYEDWHVWGTREVIVDAPTARSGSKQTSPTLSHRPPLISSSSNSSTIESTISRPSRQQKIVARVSKHSLRLERQYQFNKEILDHWDPNAEKHLRALELLRLPARTPDETTLTVILLEDVERVNGINDMRHVVNYGPNWFFFDRPPQTHPWDPSKTSSGLYPAGHISIAEFLNIAIGACECLEMIHQGSEFVHGELRGDCFYYNRAENSVRLQNYGSGLRTFENGLTNSGWMTLAKESGIEHKLHFIAPEQTGRSISQPDSRTDLYALGILFYNILTGELPYSAGSPLQIIQAVLSRRVPSVVDKRVDTPDALGAIIQKMVQKNIDDRYYSASGVKYDLKAVQRLLSDGDRVRLQAFKVASKDVNPYFRLPTGLVGREDERELMLQVLNRVAAHDNAALTTPHQRISASFTSGSSKDSQADASSQDYGGSVTQSSPAIIGRVLSPKHDVFTEPTDPISPEIDEATLDNEDGGLVKPMPSKRLSSFDGVHNGRTLVRSYSSHSVDTADLPHRTKPQNKRGSITEVIVLTGAPGLGKSSLIQDLQPAMRARGYLCRGKFDQTKKTPFDAVYNVMSQVFKQIFLEPDLHSSFHINFKAFVRPFWGVLAGMLGLPEALLGDGISTPYRANILKRKPSRTVQTDWETKSISTENVRVGSTPRSSRFTAIYLDVLRFLCSQKLIIFCLDDITFADDESLDLLQSIQDAKIPMLLLLTCRDKAILSPKARALCEGDVASITHIELKPLSESQVGDFIAATMHRDPEYVYALTAVIYEKGGGNPFYIREMLDTCYRKHAITYDWKESQWCYNLDVVFGEFASPEYGTQVNNDFIISRFMDLPQNSRRFLAIAACVGSVFSFKLVKVLMSGNTNDSPKENVQEVLGQVGKSSINPHKADFVRKASQDAVRGLQAAIASYIVAPYEEDDDLFVFCHDRYQQAALSLPECHNLKDVHFNIAQAMFRHSPEEHELYDLASHIGSAINLVKQRVAYRSQYRQVLIKSAEKSIDAGGRASGLTYYTNALALLQKDPWVDGDDVDYHETLNLFVKTAECYWLQGFVEPALALIDTSLRKARDAVDRVPAHILHARILARRGDMAGSLRILKACLKELGLDVTQGTFADCDRRFLELRPVLENGSALERLAGPILGNAGMSARGAVLCEAMAGAFWSDPLLYYHLALAEVELHIAGGNTTWSGLAYIHIGAVAITRFGLIRLGYSLGVAGKQFFETTHHNTFAAGRAGVLFSMLIGHFGSPLSNSVPLLEGAIEKTLLTGDRFFALITLGYTVVLKIWLSQDMQEIEHYCEWGADEIEKWQDDVRGAVLIIAARQYARALQGKTRFEVAHTVMDDNHHDSVAYLQYIHDKSSNPERSRSFYLTFELPILFIYGHIKEAVEVGDDILKDMELYWCTRFVVSSAYYQTLATLALLREEPNHPRKEWWLSEARRRQKKADLWGEIDNANMTVISGIMLAQLQEHDKEFSNCLLTYEKTIDDAEVHNFTFEQALATELYAEFLIRRGANRPARKLLGEAIAIYRRISCYGKATHVAIKHEYLMTGTTSLHQVTIGTQTTETVDPRSTGLPVGDNSQQGASTLSNLRQPASPRTSRNEKLNLDEPKLENMGLDMIDVAGLLSSSQVLASELNVDRLLAKLTNIILESTGADLTGIIVRTDDSVWRVAAISDTGSNDYPSNEALEDVEDIICTTVALGCLRFKETVITENVLQDNAYSKINESYRSRHPGGRAVCAMPIFHGEQTIIGCLYIEGPPQSFSDRCMTVMRLLSNPVSISMHNAMLFHRVEKVSASNALMVESQKDALAKARDAEKKAKIAEAEAIRNVKLKEEAAKAKSLFLANVSHELRTPLNGVIGMSELLRGSTLSIEQYGYTESIRVCADTLLTVINDILDYSKLDAGKMVLHSIPMSVMETINEVVRALSFSHMHQHDVQTLTQLDLDKDMLVLGDPVRFHQILMNLLSNAYKFTAHGSITVKAVVNYEDDKELNLTVSVRDTGLGISEEQQRKLFLPFSQADSSTARSYGGTGLGLSICKAIVETAMHGKIWMDSELGEGTTVSFTLALPKVAKAVSAMGEGAGKPRSDPMAMFSPKSFPAGLPSGQVFSPPALDLEKNQIRICIAEDNAVNQKIAIAYVKKLGYSCEAYADGRLTVDALTAASKAGRPFHLVLMDCQMPVLDGYNATREIRKHDDPIVKGVIIVAMTASAVRGDREACLAAGMNNYLAKPVKQQVLKQLLEGYLELGANGFSGNESADSATG